MNSATHLGATSDKPRFEITQLRTTSRNAGTLVVFSDDRLPVEFVERIWVALSAASSGQMNILRVQFPLGDGWHNEHAQELVTRIRQMDGRSARRRFYLAIGHGNEGVEAAKADQARELFLVTPSEPPQRSSPTSIRVHAFIKKDDLRKWHMADPDNMLDELADLTVNGSLHLRDSTGEIFSVAHSYLANLSV